MANKLLNGLLLALLLDEVTGSADRVDASVNGNDVQVEAGTILGTAGIKDGAQNFGTDEANRMSRADDGTFDFDGSSSFSVGSWFRQAASQNNPMIAKHDGSVPSDEAWLLQQSVVNDRVRFVVSDDGTANTTLVEPASGTTPNTTWNLVTAGFDFANQEIWIQLNSVARNTAAHTTGIFQASVPLTIGWFQAGSRIMGNQEQDETYVWNRFIASADHLLMYDSGAGLFFSSFDGGGDSYNHYYREMN